MSEHIDTFCEKCSAKKIEEWTGLYKKKTGEKDFRLICPLNPCEHSGHDDELSERSSIGSFLAFMFLQPDFKCRRCGKTGHLPD